MDAYERLGVEKDATQEHIKDAYRRQAQRHHPDKTGGDDTLFKLIKEAYEILSDEQRKAHYDKHGFDAGVDDYRSRVVGAFTSLLTNIIDVVDDIDKTNIIYKMRVKVAEQQEKARNDRSSLDRTIEKMKRVKSRIKLKGDGINLAAEIIDKKIADAEATQEAIDGKLRLCTDLQAMIKLYEYETDNDMLTTGSRPYSVFGGFLNLG